MNQLWRNQLLALALEEPGISEYQHVSFSVVKHPRNTALDVTLAAYKQLIGAKQQFAVHNSTDFVSAAERQGDPVLSSRATWYRVLYDLL